MWGKRSVSNQSQNQPADGPVRCPACMKPMRNEALIVLADYFHPECLKCGYCSKGLTQGQSCFMHESKFVCQTCFSKKLASKCSRCQKSIDGSFVTLFNKDYHAACLPTCSRCQKSPPDKQYSTINEKVHCVECYWIVARNERQAQLAKMKSAQTPPTAPK